MDGSKTDHRRASKRLYVLGAVVGIAFVLTACGASKSDTADNTFSVDGQVAGNANQMYQNGKCVFPDFTFSPGETAVLRGADNTILATDQLKIGPSMYVLEHGGICSLAFHFDKVKSGEPGYQLNIGGGEAIVVTEHQLRSENFEVRPREAIGALAGNPTITIQPES